MDVKFLADVGIQAFFPALLKIFLGRLHGGTIKIKSQLGHGSRFRFTARFIRQHGHEARQEEAFHPELGGLRVLVADDNRSSRKILKEILEIHKMDLVQAAGAKKAMDILLKSKAEGSPFNLILLDSDMPEMDGFEKTVIRVQNDQRVKTGRN